jgi:hypothetical protein
MMMESISKRMNEKRMITAILIILFFILPSLAFGQIAVFKGEAGGNDRFIIPEGGHYSFGKLPAGERLNKPVPFTIQNTGQKAIEFTSEKITLVNVDATNELYFNADLLPLSESINPGSTATFAFTVSCLAPTKFV